eukprot:Skav212606  [mRNA]  locus=scaffold2176:119650:120783:- [translate_table: standard]
MGEQRVDDRFLLYHERTLVKPALDFPAISTFGSMRLHVLRLAVLQQRISDWTDEYWLDDNTTSLSVDTVYMNPALGTWTFEQITWFFENNGILAFHWNSVDIP